MTFVLTESENDFIQSFCDGSFPPEEFKHRQHMHLGWLYCQLYTPSEAILKICADIRAFTQRVGEEDKFNLTLTILLTAMIYLRIDAQQNFSDWLNINTDLDFHAMDLVRQYYTANTLQSEATKKTFVWPDVGEFPLELQKILHGYFA